MHYKDLVYHQRIVGTIYIPHTERIHCNRNDRYMYIIKILFIISE